MTTIVDNDDASTQAHPAATGLRPLPSLRERSQENISATGSTAHPAQLVQSQPERWLRVADVAHLLSLPPRTVYKLIADEEIPCVTIGRAIRITRDAYERFVADKEAEAQQQGTNYGSKARE